MRSRGLKAGWLLLTVGALAFTCLKIDADQNRDLDLVLAWIMIVLCFPASVVGILVNAAFGFIAQDVMTTMSRSVHVFATWLIFFACGYFQWFVLLPYAVRRWRKRKPTTLTTQQPPGA
jgi:hypothetical protein